MAEQHEASHGPAASSDQDRFHVRIGIRQRQPAIEALADGVSLSRGRLKYAMECGAVWLSRPGRKTGRIRKAKFLLVPGDIIELFYDAAILQRSGPPPTLTATGAGFSVWYKPAQILTQGSRYGDHLSLLRLAERELGLQGRLHVVHRLDREAWGLVVLAHNRHVAAELSRQFALQQVEKRYWARVHGLLGPEASMLELNQPLDGKPARTLVTIGTYAANQDTTAVQIELKTGRYHQIRRHLSQSGHPLCGDWRYGSRRDNCSELQLCAWRLAFADPDTGRQCRFTLAKDLLPF